MRNRLLTIWHALILFILYSSILLGSIAFILRTMYYSYISKQIKKAGRADVKDYKLPQRMGKRLRALDLDLRGRPTVRCLSTENRWMDFMLEGTLESRLAAKCGTGGKGVG